MAKQSGLGDQLFIDGTDIGADVASIGNLSTPRETLNATGITQYANARMYGKRDGQVEFVTFFNDEVAGTHATLKALPRTDAHIMYLRGQGLGSEGIGLVGKQVDYAPTRGDDGSLTFAVSALANGFGIDWGDQLTTGIQADAAATDSDGLDTVTSAAFGWQAYLQVFSLGSGTADIAIEDSADDITYDPLSGGAFASVTTKTVERLQSSSATATVRRYVRVSTTGTFADLVFAVVFTKNRALRAI
jgi:hypothetical protein